MAVSNFYFLLIVDNFEVLWVSLFVSVIKQSIDIDLIDKYLILELLPMFIEPQGYKAKHLSHQQLEPALLHPQLQHFALLHHTHQHVVQLQLLLSPQHPVHVQHITLDVVLSIHGLIIHLPLLQLQHIYVLNIGTLLLNLPLLDPSPLYG